MPTVGPGGFWSYAHADDAAAQGRVIQLSKDLRDAYSLLTGEELAIFVDRESIAWGEEWRSRINGALVNTTFFIPILTPRYFTRPECKKELLTFVSQAESLGFSELVMPILYTPVRNFGEGNEDEAIVLASKAQYVDWTSLRFEGTASPAYLRTVNDMAERLVEIGLRVADRQLSHEVQPLARDQGAEFGLLELMQKIEHLLPEWIDALEMESVNTRQFDATWELYYPRIHRYEVARNAGGARLATLQKLGRELLPLGRRHAELVRQYAAKTFELDPLITAAVRIAGVHAEDLFLLRPVREAMKIPERNWEIAAEHEAAGRAMLTDWCRRREHLSRVMREVADVHEGAAAGLDDANEVVRRWIAELDRVAVSAGDSDIASDPSA